MWLPGFLLHPPTASASVASTHISYGSRGGSSNNAAIFFLHVYHVPGLEWTCYIHYHLCMTDKAAKVQRPKRATIQGDTVVK